ncbi:DUF6932 family protein [Streptomyces sp. NPDC087420]|uniref:DUF6932 family protein n=1 Tax=Streptomyces sp. NPDC087420 TaxID=3365785 RepID=UPI003837279F
MPVPELTHVRGMLPVGRYECTEEEVESAFVSHERYVASTTRQSIWNDWETARDTLRSLVRVHGVWIAGSFTTDKLDPGDIDVVFIVGGEEYDQLDNREKAMVSLFATGGAGAAHHNLQVDSYMLPWKCFPIPDLSDEGQSEYFSRRGYWDDFWLRTRSGAKDDPPVGMDATPKRGYLEVKFDEYL